MASSSLRGEYKYSQELHNVNVFFLRHLILGNRNLTNNKLADYSVPTRKFETQHLKFYLNSESYKMYSAAQKKPNRERERERVQNG